MTETTPVVQLDCRGLTCPLPILQSAEKLAQMESGEILEVLGTDPNTKKQLEAFAEREGHHFLGFEEDGVYSRYFIKKG